MRKGRPSAWRRAEREKRSTRSCQPPASLRFRTVPSVCAASMGRRGRDWQYDGRLMDVRNQAGAHHVVVRPRPDHVLRERRPVAGDPGATLYCSLVDTPVMVVLSLVPTAVNATMAATEISEAMRPYSMAVAPLLSFISFLNRDSIGNSPRK